MQPRTQKVVFFLAYQSLSGKHQGHVTSEFTLTETQVNNSDTYEEIIASISRKIRDDFGFGIFITAFNRLN
jgi:hypothetical protein